VAAEPRLAARLLAAPHLEGLLWHADHKTAVADGGGECTVDNMQVLCVACHAEKTRREARGRRLARREARTARAEEAADTTPSAKVESPYFAAGGNGAGSPAASCPARRKEAAASACATPRRRATRASPYFTA